MIFENKEARETARKAWEFFQANKTFTLKAFSIVVGLNEKNARKWLTGAVRSGMLNYLKNNNYNSTETYLQEMEHWIQYGQEK